ncbi:YiiX/YebB-like N1pC/P60 family cysteine hydrolase [Thermophagus sp. OGC60D27]|uniref:YiiX/YebB-like N1pC/P60 family cysteine hydrolase n=1 Tax=Thermophagus sp. OGC60D27 TaxID=3458415 RepID=UPI004037B4A8
MLKKNYCIFLLLSAIVYGCHPSDNIGLRTGDLLFRGKTDSGLSEAIDEVTNTVEENHFSHVGLVELVGKDIYVVHADYESGVCKQPLDSFLMDEDGNLQYTIAYRLRDEFSGSINEAVRRANSVIGQPYNESYVVEDTGFYCSELIWWAFLRDSVFSLEPMTFKNPQTGEFPEAWLIHYQKLGIEIPEGKPGCNPNGMATSEEIYRLGVVTNR